MARSLAVPQFGAHRAPLQPAPWARQGVLLLAGLLVMAVAAIYERRRSLVRTQGLRRAAPRAKSPVRTPALQWTAAFGVTLLFVLLWAACGGGGGGTPAPPPTGTPAGSYNLTLTATADGVSKTATLTLRVN
jgi:hypothetical protein